MRWKNGRAEYVSVKDWETPSDENWHEIYTAPHRATGEPVRQSESLRQHADAWMAVCALLHELRPGWCEGPESMQEQALKAIRALAQEAEWCAPDGGVFGYFRPTMDGWEDCSEGDVGAVALYEHPHLQPLTDKQIQDVWCSAKNEGNQHGPFWFARAIERAHGIT